MRDEISTKRLSSFASDVPQNSPAATNTGTDLEIGEADASPSTESDKVENSGTEGEHFHVLFQFPGHSETSNKLPKKLQREVRVFFLSFQQSPSLPQANRKGVSRTRTHRTGRRTRRSRTCLKSLQKKARLGPRTKVRETQVKLELSAVSPAEIRTSFHKNVHILVKKFSDHHTSFVDAATTTDENQVPENQLQTTDGAVAAEAAAETVEPTESDSAESVATGECRMKMVSTCFHFSNIQSHHSIHWKLLQI